MQVTIVAALLSLAALTSAQETGGLGRFQCSTRTAAGTVEYDQSLCADDTIQTLITDNVCKPSGSSVDVSGFKSDGIYPTGSECYPSFPGGPAYCGIAGASCTVDANCDNGSCAAGICVGGFGTPCTADSQCTGNLYCSGSSVGNFQPSCGYTAVNPAGTADEDVVGGSYCADYCAAGSFLCANGGLCDVSSAANVGNGGCYSVLAVGPSQRARARRDVATPSTRSRVRCLAPNSVCPTTSGVAGFECVDTTSNLEQCGACAASGGVDCTALPGVDAVGCVAGQCEIWACAESFMWDAATSSCTPALVA